jgi:ABC-type transport system involved in multi-copper enzyme maturation permease subunit
MMAVSISILLFKAIIFICLEVMVVAAVAVLYSTFTRATLSAVFTLAIYAIGHLTADLKALGAKLDAIGRICVNAMYYILPNLERFNLKGHVIHGLDIGGMEMTVIISYGVIYTLFLLLMAMIIFQRRDFQ